MSSTEQKAISGHPYILRTMSGELAVALYYGPGKCSSCFRTAETIQGPAKPLGHAP